MKKNMTAFYKIGCLIIIMAVVSGCVSTSGNFGKLRPDDQVKKAFEKFTVPEGYNYYYFGQSSFPKAFIGVSKEFKLESSLWEPINLTSEILRNWIWVHATRPESDTENYGSNIVGPNNEHIGVYYSLGDWRQWVTVELVGDNTVKIGGPISESGRRGPTRNYL